jgi:hypothetical protein
VNIRSSLPLAWTSGYIVETNKRSDFIYVCVGEKSVREFRKKDSCYSSLWMITRPRICTRHWMRNRRALSIFSMSEALYAEDLLIAVPK